MTESKSSLISSFDIRHPQVVIIYEGNETGITRWNLGVHANPWALCLNFHRLQWGSLLNITWLSGMGTQISPKYQTERSRRKQLDSQWSRYCRHHGNRKGCCLLGRGKGRFVSDSRRTWCRRPPDASSHGEAPPHGNIRHGAESPIRWTQINIINVIMPHICVFAAVNVTEQNMEKYLKVI